VVASNFTSDDLAPLAGSVARRIEVHCNDGAHSRRQREPLGCGAGNNRASHTNHRRRRIPLVRVLSTVNVALPPGIAEAHN
jgi:hypothetical protein